LGVKLFDEMTPSSTHNWRKTFVRKVWKSDGQSEASLLRLSSLFNHSSIAITRIYLSIIKEEVDNLYQIENIFCLLKSILKNNEKLSIII
jgi:site-specific recombinase XerD